MKTLSELKNEVVRLNPNSAEYIKAVFKHLYNQIATTDAGVL